MTKDFVSHGDVVLYEAKDGNVRLNVQLDGETVWLTQPQMSVLFGRDVSVIRKHVKNVYEEGELEEESTRAKIALVQNEAGRSVERQVDAFNLDVVISVGYRVKSVEGVRFRQWATKILREYAIKGFSLDDERLKEGRSRYFRELLQRVRDIRSSERNLYQQVTDIYATSIDYDSKSKTTREFFATVQNKLHYAAHEHTAAEIVFERVSRGKPFVGMTNFKGDYVTREDVGIAKNYLTEKELQTLNLIVSRFLDYAELQALEERAMTMQDWIDELDREIVNTRRALLEGKGVVSHRQAIEKAEEEFEAYRAKEMRELESDFDRAIKQLEGDSREQD
ncbi:MAG: virulence RhuM family protein [Actinomycetaceae bacterium]|nr:virulence RhuM family protein [Actinomycetaceae bacterium]